MAFQAYRREPLQSFRQHKLVPATHGLPPLGSTDGQGMEAIARLRLFAPVGRYVLYVTEFDGHDTLYGYCLSFAGSQWDEWGYVSLTEIAEQAIGGVPTVERDRAFRPTPVGECEGVKA
jgi:hypothetical protein